MRIPARAAVLAAAAALVLSGCGSGGGSGAFVASVQRSADPFAILLGHSRDLGRLPASRVVSLTLLLRDPTARQRAAELAAIYLPSSPSFGRFLRPSDLRRYGPGPETVKRTLAYLRAEGLYGNWQPGSAWLTVRGPARAMERLSRVDIHRYVTPSGRRFFAAARNPIVPPELRPLVTAAGRISSYQQGLHLVPRAVPSGGLKPDDLLNAYDLKPLRDLGLDGSGETVAFVEIDGFRQSDFDQFTSTFGLPAMHPTIKLGGSSSKVEGEAEMDLEVVHEIAPGARLVVYNCFSCTGADLAQARDTMARQNPGAIISDSIGGCEGNMGFANTESDRRAYDDAASLGISAFAASGDSGAFDCLDFGSPPSQTYIGADEPPSVPGVTSVGGTRLSLNSDSTWYREQVWENAGETAGSGGAPSQFYARPAWQNAPGVTGVKRQQPDVAADADPVSSPALVIAGQDMQVGGTSQAAPIWAGMTALIDQYLHTKGVRRVGFMNPALYALARTTQPYPPFHDILVGTNLVFRAAPGYDLATGLGTPDGWNLARDLEQYIKGGGK